MDEEINLTVKSETEDYEISKLEQIIKDLSDISKNIKSNNYVSVDTLYSTNSEFNLADIDNLTNNKLGVYNKSNLDLTTKCTETTKNEIFIKPNNLDKYEHKKVELKSFNKSFTKNLGEIKFRKSIYQSVSSVYFKNRDEPKDLNDDNNLHEYELNINPSDMYVNNFETSDQNIKRKTKKNIFFSCFK